jgi:nucleotide-binding universal stress UspA family protein
MSQENVELSPLAVERGTGATRKPQWRSWTPKACGIPRSKGLRGTQHVSRPRRDAGVGLVRRSYLANLPRMNAAAPILIGYDGSDTARRAVHEAAELFGSRRALVVTVWEPGLAYEASAMTADPTGQGPEPVDSAAAQEVDDASQAHADRVAEDGAALANSLGLQAEALAVADEGNVADAIVELARTRDVAAIVVGSRGLSGLRARLEGSTSNAVAKHASCPVVLVHDD